MKKRFVKFAACAALLSCGQAQAAQTANCITPAEMHGLVGYLAPVLVDRFSQKCSDHFSAGSMVRTSLPALIGRLEENRDSNWPMARAAFLKFGASDSSKAAMDMAKLSDRALRPLVDELLGAKLNMPLTPANCRDAEEVVQALLPLSGDELVNLVSVVMGVAMRKDRSNPTCARAE